jgi:hypothetical protein
MKERMSKGRIVEADRKHSFNFENLSLFPADFFLQFAKQQAEIKISFA